MEACRQLCLLLKRNFILRRRQPVILGLELLWPIVIFLAVMAMRWSLPPVNQNSCRYNSWALPTVGGVPFLQSLICNIDNDCLNETQYEEIPSYPQAKIHDLLEGLNPLMNDERMTRFILALPNGMKLMRAVVDVLAEPQIQTFIDKGIPVKSLIRKNAETLKILKQVKLSTISIEILFNSYIKLPKLVELLVSSDPESLSCDSGSFTQLISPGDGDAALESLIEDISKTFCSLDSTSKNALLQGLTKQIDIESIVQMVSQVMQNFGRQDISLILDDIVSMVTALTSWMSSQSENISVNQKLLTSILEDISGVYQDIFSGDIDFRFFSQIADDFSSLYEHTEWMKLKTLLNHVASVISDSTGSDMTVQEVVAPTHSRSPREVLLPKTIISSSDNDLRQISQPDLKADTFSDPFTNLKYSAGFLDLTLYLLKILPQGNKLHMLGDYFVLYWEDTLEMFYELFYFADLKNFQNLLDFAESALFTVLDKNSIGFDSRTWDEVICDPVEFLNYFYIPKEVDGKSLQSWACGQMKAIKKIFSSLKNKAGSKTPPKAFHSEDFVKKFKDIMNLMKINVFDNKMNVLGKYKNMLQEFIQKLQREGKLPEGSLVLVTVDELSRQLVLAEPANALLTFHEMFHQNNYPASWRAASVIRFSLWMASSVSQFLDEHKQNGTLHTSDILKLEGVQEFENLIKLSPFTLQLLVEASINPILYSEITQLMSQFSALLRNYAVYSCSSLVIKTQNDQTSCFPSSVLPQIHNFTLESHQLLDSLGKAFCVILRHKHLVDSREDDIVGVIRKLVAMWENGTLSDLPPLNFANAARMFSTAELLHTTVQEGNLKAILNKSWIKTMDNVNRIISNENHINRLALNLQNLAPLLKQILTLNGKFSPALPVAAELLHAFSEAISNASKENGTIYLHDVVKNSTSLSSLVNWAEQYFIVGIEAALFTLSSKPELLIHAIRENNSIDFVCSKPVSTFLTIPSDINSARVEIGRKKVCDLFKNLSSTRSQCDIEDEVYSNYVIRSFLWSLGEVMKDGLSDRGTVNRLTSSLFYRTRWEDLLRNYVQHNNITTTPDAIKFSAELVGKVLAGTKDPSIIDHLVKASTCALQILNEEMNVTFWNVDQTSARRTIWTILEEFLGIIRIGMASANDPQKIAAVFKNFVLKKGKSFDICNVSLKEWKQYFKLDIQTEKYFNKFISHMCTRSFSSFFLPSNVISLDCIGMMHTIERQNFSSTKFGENVEEFFKMLNVTVIKMFDFGKRSNIPRFEVNGMINKWRDVLMKNLTFMDMGGFQMLLQLLDTAESETLGNPTTFSVIQWAFHSLVSSLSDPSISSVDRFKGSMIPIKIIPSMFQSLSNFAEFLVWKTLGEGRPLAEINHHSLCQQTGSRSIHQPSRLISLAYLACDKSSRFKNVTLPGDNEMFKQLTSFNVTNMAIDWLLLKNIWSTKPNSSSSSVRNRFFRGRSSVQLPVADTIIASLNIIIPLNDCISENFAIKVNRDVKQLLCIVTGIQKAQQLLKASYGGNISMAVKHPNFHHAEFNYLFGRTLDLLSLFKAWLENNPGKVNEALVEISMPLELEDSSYVPSRSTIFNMLRVIRIFVSPLEERKIGIPVFHTLHFLLKGITNRMQIIGQSNSTGITLEELFPRSPVTQNVVKDLLPHFPQIVTTLFWSFLTEGKLQRWIRESKRNVTVAQSLMCDHPVKDYFYNPDFLDSDWSNLMSAVCPHDYFKVFEELVNDPYIQPIIFEADIEDPIEWDEIFEDSVNFSRSVKFFVKKSLIQLPKKTSWSEILTNISKSSRDPAVIAYVLSNNFFYKFCDSKNSYYFLNFTNQASVPNATKVLCDLSKPVFAKNVVGNISKILDQVSNEQVQKWKKIYFSLTQSLQLKDIFSALFGSEITAAMEKLEYHFFNFITNRQQLSGVDYEIGECIEDVWNLIYHIDIATPHDLINQVLLSSFPYFADDLNDFIREGVRSFEAVIEDDKHLQALLEKIHHLNVSDRLIKKKTKFMATIFNENLGYQHDSCIWSQNKRQMNRKVISLNCNYSSSDWLKAIQTQYISSYVQNIHHFSWLTDVLPNNIIMEVSQKLKEKEVQWLSDTFKSLFFQMRSMDYPNKLSLKTGVSTIKYLLKALHTALYVENTELCIQDGFQMPESFVNDIVSKLSSSKLDADFLLCNLSLMDLPSAYNWISRTISLNETVRKAVKWKHHGSKFPSCLYNTDLLFMSLDFVDTFIFSVITSNLTHLASCANQAIHGSLVNGIYTHGSLLGNIFKIISSFAESTVQGISGFRELVDLIINQLPGFTKVAEIENSDFVNISRAFFPDDILEELRRSSLNLNWVVRNKFSSMAFYHALCDDTEKQYVLLPESSDGFNSRIFDSLCHQSNATSIFIKYINESVVVNKLHVFQEREFNSSGWLASLLSNSRQILDDLLLLMSNIDQLNFTLASSLSFPKISDKKFEQLIMSLENLIDHLKPIFEGSSLMDFFRKLLHGLRGFQSLQKLNVFEVGRKVKEVVSNPNATRMSLMNTFHLSDEDIDHIFNLRINNSEISILKDKDINVCEFLDINAVAASIKENVTVTLCYLNKTGFLSILPESFKEISPIDYVKKFIQLAMDGVLQIAKLSQMDVKETVEILKDVSLILPEMSHNLEKVSSIIEPDIRKQISTLNITTEGIAALGTASALNAGGKILCGKPLKTIQKKFAFASSEEKAPQLDYSEIEQMPDEFCRHGYKQVMNLAGGPIVWGFLKPLFRGKVLYAPNSGWAQMIIQKMNNTFERMSDHVTLLEAMAKGITGYRYLENQKHVLRMIKNYLTAEPMYSLLRNFLDTQSINMLQDFDLENLNHELGHSESMLEIIELVGNVSQCFSLDRFVGYNTEAELENAAGRLHSHKEFIAALVFDEEKMEPTGERLRRSASVLPSVVQYKIRMDIDNVPSTKSIRYRWWRPYAYDDFFDDMRYFRGFVQLQDLVDTTILELQTADHLPVVSTRKYLQQFPYPCHEEDKFGTILKSSMPAIMTVSWLFIIAFLVREIVLERELSLDEIMRVMGLRPLVGWMAWFLSGLLVLLVSVIGIVIILKAGGIMPHSDSFILFIFIFDFAVLLLSYCYLMSVFFKNAPAAALIAIIVYVLSFFPFLLYITWEVHFFFWQKILACCLVATAFCFGCLYFNRFEDQGQGVQWHNLWISPVPHDEDMNLATAMIIMAFCSAAYFLLAWYISRVWPVGRESTKQPWYFFLTATYWGIEPSNDYSNDRFLSVHFSEGQLNLVEDSKNWNSDDEDGNSNFSSGKIGISIKDLSVTFKEGKLKEKKAVDQLNLSLYEGHITTLLGHNGAGKTTTIKVLTGRCNPTSGSVTIYGVPIVQGHLSKIRKFIGYCPQYNILYEKLTVREHLLFFAKLKGVLSGKQLEDDVDSLLRSMGLLKKQNDISMHLSGGQRRRLCVALAFVGGSKVIILDEPTSSVDPVARRSIWELIVRHKQGRTILLCTHHLDEADILSNRVAILHKGKLLCCGSPLLLKTNYGYGYQLTISGASTEGSLSGSDSGHSSCGEEHEFNRKKNCDGEIMEFIQNYIPLATILQSNSVELVVSLPHETPDGKVARFSQFFADLDQNIKEMGFCSYSLSSTSLEQVFLTLCSHEDSKKVSNTTRQQSQYCNLVFKEDSVGEFGDSQLMNFSSQILLTGWLLKLSQIHCLLRKRYEHTKRNWKALTCAIILPSLFIALAMALTVGKPERKPEPPLVLSPNLYSPATLSFIGQVNVATDSCLPILDTLVTYPVDEPICFDPGWWANEECLNISDSNLKSVLQGLKSDDSDQQCICETEKCLSSSSEPIFIKPHEAIYNLTGYDIPQYLIDSYILFNEKRYGGWTCTGGRNMTDFAKVWFDNSGYHAAPSYLSALNNAILKANIMSYVKQEHYGIRTLNHPLQLSAEQLSQETLLNRLSEVGIAFVFLIGLALIPSSFSVYIINERVREEKRLQWVGGVGPLLYWTAAILWDMFLLLNAICLCSIVVASFNLPTFVHRENFSAVVCLMVLFGWATTPMTYVFSKFFREASLAFMVLFSINLFIGLIIMLAVISMKLITLSSETHGMLQVLKSVALLFPQFSLVGGLTDLAQNQIQSEILALFGQDTYVNPFTMKLLLPNLICMAFQGIIFFIFNILWEIYSPYINIRKLKNILCGRNISHGFSLSDGISKSDLLIVEKLDKVYYGNEGMKYAVKGLTLGVPKGECFGLLGVNGAGKTTLFRILTGETTPSNGSVTLNNMDVSKVLDSGQQLIGYCPQSDALDNMLTPRQHLHIYSQLIGIPWKDIPQIVSRTLSAFDLQSQANSQVRTLSGGNKRKVCTAIAMLGNPQLLLLDEPTSGMDPMTRRLVWKRIRCATKNQQSVIFASHSIEECDILCSRIGIMVNGSFCALGTPHQLKHKYGIGYTVTLRTSSTSINVHEFIRHHFPTAEVKAQHCDTVEFCIPNKDFHSLGEIFRNFESARDKLKIEDLSIDQTTLDQVFVDFARRQSDGVELLPNVQDKDANFYRHISSSSSEDVEFTGVCKLDINDCESAV